MIDDDESNETDNEQLLMGGSSGRTSTIPDDSDSDSETDGDESESSGM